MRSLRSTIRTMDRQRGFLSSIYLYGIAALVVAGLGYGLYYQIQKNGRLSSENATLIASVEWSEKQRKAEAKAQESALKAKEQAERDANMARRELVDVRRKYAELMDQLLPLELIDRLRRAIAKANGDLPAAQPDGKLPAS